MLTNNVAYFRKRARLTQTELAIRIGTTINNVGKLERGDRQLNDKWLGRISCALRVQPYELIAPLVAGGNISR